VILRENLGDWWELELEDPSANEKDSNQGMNMMPLKFSSSLDLLLGN